MSGGAVGRILGISETAGRNKLRGLTIWTVPDLIRFATVIGCKPGQLFEASVADRKLPDVIWDGRRGTALPPKPSAGVKPKRAKAPEAVQQPLFPSPAPAKKDGADE